MAKQLVNQRRLYKIQSSRFRLNKWNLTLNDKNTASDEIVSIGDNQVLEFIRQINGIDTTQEESEINELKSHIKVARRQKKNTEAKQLYKQLNDKLFVKQLCFVVIEKDSDYHKLNKSMILNGMKFKRLFATTGGVKTSTIIYIQDIIHEEMSKRVENGRDNSKDFSAGKLEAYKSLAFSNSIKVRNPINFVVVKDYKTIFKDTIIELDDSTTKYPTFNIVENADIEIIDSDGYGIMLPSYADKIKEDLELDYRPAGILLRNSFLKGMCFCVNFVEFAESIAKTNEIVDVYGRTFDLVNDSVEMIIPESVFKLSESYGSYADYRQCCDENGYSFRVAKVTPKKLENERNLNYQFIQPLDLSQDDIVNLCEPTVRYIKDIVNDDPYKAILFTKGVDLSDENLKYGKSDFTKALMIEPKMINDPFVKGKIHDMAKRKIKDAKIGVLKCPSNFQTASGDIYGFMEHIFSMPENLRKNGLLKSGEVYSKYWVDKKVEDITIFRAPMSSHNNIRKMKVVNNEDVTKWYEHINTCMIINSWDTVSHALNGMDKDGDSVFSTNMKSLQSNVNKLPAVICKQKTAPKKICEFEDFISANINGFGDEIGSITNKITSMFCIQSNFKKDSKEYKELEYRIICGQLYQQNAIDKIKSIQANPMPKEWYNTLCHIKKDEKGYIRNEFELSIVAEKKPYFFIHNYKTLHKEYVKYITDIDSKSIHLFGVKYNDLMGIENKTSEAIEFIKRCELNNPVNHSPSTMNKICWYVESQLNDIKLNGNCNFDTELIKTKKKYSNTNYQQVKKVYEEYKVETSNFAKNRKANHNDEINDENQRQLFIQKFKEKCVKVEDEDLANIIVDLCYNTNNSKQFAWDVAGEQILKNLLKRNKHNISYPQRDENGDILFNGEKFLIKTIKVGDGFATDC